MYRPNADRCLHSFWSCGREMVGHHAAHTVADNDGSAGGAAEPVQEVEDVNGDCGDRMRAWWGGDMGASSAIVVEGDAAVGGELGEDGGPKGGGTPQAMNEDDGCYGWRDG